MVESEGNGVRRTQTRRGHGGGGAEDVFHIRSVAGMTFINLS